MLYICNGVLQLLEESMHLYTVDQVKKGQEEGAEGSSGAVKDDVRTNFVRCTVLTEKQ